MSNLSGSDKEIQRYLDGLVVLFQVINGERDLDKGIDVIHDLMLGYDVVDDHKQEFEAGLKNVKDIFIDLPRED